LVVYLTSTRLPLDTGESVSGLSSHISHSNRPPDKDPPFPSALQMMDGAVDRYANSSLPSFNDEQNSNIITVHLSNIL
jgi:hypothetical protein